MTAKFINFYSDVEETTYIYNAIDIVSVKKVKDKPFIYIQFKNGIIQTHEFSTPSAAFYAIDKIWKQLGGK